MTIKNINRIRTLWQRNNPVQSVTIEEALGDFLTFIKQVKNSDEVNNNLTVLIHRFQKKNGSCTEARLNSPRGKY